MSSYHALLVTYNKPMHIAATMMDWLLRTHDCKQARSQTTACLLDRCGWRCLLAGTLGCTGTVPQHQNQPQWCAAEHPWVAPSHCSSHLQQRRVTAIVVHSSVHKSQTVFIVHHKPDGNGMQAWQYEEKRIPSESNSVPKLMVFWPLKAHRTTRQLLALNLVYCIGSILNALVSHYCLIKAFFRLKGWQLLWIELGAPGLRH